jgi:hypothetical protein
LSWWTVHPYTATGTTDGTYQKRTEAPFRTPLTGLDSVRPIRDFFEQRAIDMGEFEPDHALVEAAAAHSDAQTPRLMRRGKQEFLIYHPHAAGDEQAAQVNMDGPAKFRLDLRAAEGKFSVEWYRAEDGQAQDGAEVTARDWCQLTAPWSGADVIVRLLENDVSKGLIDKARGNLPAVETMQSSSGNDAHCFELQVQPGFA